MFGHHTVLEGFFLNHDRGLILGGVFFLAKGHKRQKGQFEYTEKNPNLQGKWVPFNECLEDHISR